MSPVMDGPRTTHLLSTGCQAGLDTVLEGWVLQKTQWCSQLHGCRLSDLNQVLPLLITLQLLIMDRGLVPQTLPASGCLYQPLGTEPCCPHHKTSSYLALQVHGLSAALAPGLSPASTSL